MGRKKKKTSNPNNPNKNKKKFRYIIESELSKDDFIEEINHFIMKSPDQLNENQRFKGTIDGDQFTLNSSTHPPIVYKGLISNNNNITKLELTLRYDDPLRLIGGFIFKIGGPTALFICIACIYLNNFTNIERKSYLPILYPILLVLPHIIFYFVKKDNDKKPFHLKNLEYILTNITGTITKGALKKI